MKPRIGAFSLQIRFFAKQVLVDRGQGSDQATLNKESA